MPEKIIQFNEGAIKQELSNLVRQSVEDTLNMLLDEEADRLTNATRYERTDGRVDTRAGHYKRKLLTKAGEVELKMWKRQCKVQTFRQFKCRAFGSQSTKFSATKVQ